MAQKTQITLIDDVDGSEADETVALGVDGVAYVIDLTVAHAAELRGALAVYVGADRKVGSTGKKRGSVARAVREYDPAAVREWATSNGLCVPSRGRIPVRLLAQYRAAN